jgi:hypothetical protein
VLDWRISVSNARIGRLRAGVVSLLAALACVAATLVAMPVAAQAVCSPDLLYVSTLDVASNNKGVTNLNYRIDYLDALWLDVLANKLNATTRSAVAKARKAGVPITYVEPRFSNHGLCDSATPWIHGLEFVSGTTDPSSSSFHPTATGQKSGYEPAFLRAVS